MKQRRLFQLFVGIILLSAFALRLYGLNWDQGHGLHPDERYITWVAASICLPDDLADVFHPDRTSLNPYRWPPGETERTPLDDQSSKERTRAFSYGHLPLYLMALFSGGDADEARLALVGRVLSALFDMATIVLTFALGCFLYGRAVGVLAAVFVALTVVHIQLAHFATFDTALTCFVVATLLFTARFVRHGRRRDAVLMGACLGLAVGSKFGGVLLLAPLMLAHALCWDRASARRSLGLLALSMFIAFFAFALTNPFSVLQPGVFADNLSDQSAMLRGDEAFPFTRQYQGTLPYLYPIEQQLRWGMGAPLGLVAWSGLIYILVRAWRRPFAAAEWVPLTWIIVYFGFTGSLYVKFMRYMLPLSPLLMIYGAEMLQVSKWQVPGFSRWKKRLCGGLTAVVVTATLFHVLAFLNVYRGDHPWLRLSRWIYTHVPPGATIVYEQWDHQLPLTLEQEGEIRWPGEYRQLALDVYAPDTPTKLDALLEGLAAGDYMLIASNRLYGSIARWPERYPLTQRYYQLFFEGYLGYRLIPLSNMDRLPRLGPLALVADPFEAAELLSPLTAEQDRPASMVLHLGRADESFIVYDHPRPLIFENVARLSSAEMRRLFADLE